MFFGCFLSSLDELNQCSSTALELIVGARLAFVDLCCWDPHGLVSNERHHDRKVDGRFPQRSVCLQAWFAHQASPKDSGTTVISGEDLEDSGRVRV